MSSCKQLFGIPCNFASFSRKFYGTFYNINLHNIKTTAAAAAESNCHKVLLISGFAHVVLQDFLLFHS